MSTTASTLKATDSSETTNSDGQLVRLKEGHEWHRMLIDRKRLNWISYLLKTTGSIFVTRSPTGEKKNKKCKLHQKVLLRLYKGSVFVFHLIVVASSAELGLPLLSCFQLRVRVRDDTPTDMIACKHQHPHNSRLTQHTHTRTQGQSLSLSHVQSVTNRPSQLHPFLWQPRWITLPLLPLIKDERGDGHTPGAWHGLISLILTRTQTLVHLTAV